MDLKENLKNNILKCVSDFKTFLTGSVNDLDETLTLDFLKKIPHFIAVLVEAVNTFCRISKPPKEQYFAIVVYLTQYCTTYELFQNICTYSSLEKEVIFETNRCICKRLTSLLNDIDLIFDNTDTTVGSFLVLVDAALDKIAEIDIKQGKEIAQSKLNAAYSITEEILCLSMSVAHVTVNEDNKIITAGCRSVLSTLESLKTEICQENPNLAMCNLASDTCTDTLCALEAKVNTAVLRLCLNVFSEYKQRIKSLYDFCKTDKPDNDEKLTPLISDFDLHMDQLFQIGLFSVASATIGKRVADIKNVIANLEFLEGELVPSFIAMIKDQLPYRKIFADTLKKSWCTQVKLLRQAVHGIIEPSAYCKLVYEELKQKVEDIWQDVITGNSIQKAMLEPFITYTEELGQMISSNIESFDVNAKPNVKNQLQVVHNVMKELFASRDLLLSEQSNCSTKVANQKIFKRCQILVVSIKRLWFSTLEENRQQDQDAEEKTFVIKNETIIEEDNSVLQSIITKSRQIVKDRSICTFSQTILDRTSKENTFKQLRKGKLSYLIKTINQRDCSYRHIDKVMEEVVLDDTSIATRVLPHMDKILNNSSCLSRL